MCTTPNDGNVMNIKKHFVDIIEGADVVGSKTDGNHVRDGNILLGIREVCNRAAILIKLARTD